MITRNRLHRSVHATRDREAETLARLLKACANLHMTPMQVSTSAPGHSQSIKDSQIGQETCSSAGLHVVARPSSTAGQPACPLFVQDVQVHSSSMSASSRMEHSMGQRAQHGSMHAAQQRCRRQQRCTSIGSWVADDPELQGQLRQQGVLHGRCGNTCRSKPDAVQQDAATARL